LAYPLRKLRKVVDDMAARLDAAGESMRHVVD
jgi:hypothetical protein